jgi:hypothetical protein
MLTLVISLLSCIGVIVASLLNHRAVTTAARIAAGDTIRFDSALIAAMAQLEAAQLQHDAAIEVARIQAAATVDAARMAAGLAAAGA